LPDQRHRPVPSLLTRTRALTLVEEAGLRELSPSLGTHLDVNR
jgi:hypothetical protein